MSRSPAISGSSLPRRSPSETRGLAMIAMPIRAKVVKGRPEAEAD